MPLGSGGSEVSPSQLVAKHVQIGCGLSRGRRGQELPGVVDPPSALTPPPPEGLETTPVVRPSFPPFPGARAKTAIKLMQPGVTRSEVFQERSNLPLGKERGAAPH